MRACAILLLFLVLYVAGRFRYFEWSEICLSRVLVPSEVFLSTRFPLSVQCLLFRIVRIFPSELTLHDGQTHAVNLTIEVERVDVRHAADVVEYGLHASVEGGRLDVVLTTHAIDK